MTVEINTPHIYVEQKVTMIYNGYTYEHTSTPAAIQVWMDHIHNNVICADFRRRLQNIPQDQWPSVEILTGANRTGNRCDILMQYIETPAV